jgi:hypothetical protein
MKAKVAPVAVFRREEKEARAFLTLRSAVEVGRGVKALTGGRRATVARRDRKRFGAKIP